jgi:CzcA family heavy metal efflux pump
MMRWIVRSSLKSRGLVVAVAAVVLFLGITQLREMPRDVLPEFVRPTVNVQTEALGLSAPEVEQLITVPLEQDLLNGVPFLDLIHSKSVPGMSSIELIFKKGTDLARARLVVNERLTQAVALPHVSLPPQMLQPLSSESRVMMIGLTSKSHSLIDMGVLARWTLRPRLMGVPGVANVAIWGQRERQLQVQVDPETLDERGVSLDQVISTTGNALWFSPLGRLEANTPGTGGFFDGPQQRLGIFHKSPITTQADLAKVAIEGTESAAAPALTLGDVANVVEDHQPLIGDAVLSKGPGLMLVVEKLPEANVMEVTKGVDEALRAMGPGLAGIQVDSSLFRPANYIAKSTHNVAEALLIGLVLLVLLLLALLFEWRTALIAAVTTLLSMALAVIVLHLGGATINAMVMAGLVLAVVVVVGDSIVDTENIRRRLRLKAEAGDGSAETTVLEASMEVRSPLAFGTIIVLLALVPIFVLKGETGAFAPPIALAYAAAVLASMVVALAITPALSLLLLAKAPLAGRESPLVRSVRRGHDRFLPRFTGSPRVAIGAVGVVALVGVAVLPFLEREHSLIPTFKDRDLLVHWEGAPGASLPEMDRITARVSRELRSLPGVRDVGAHVGRAVLADQVVNVNSGELWVNIDRSADYRKTVSSVQKVVNGYPGLEHSVLTYPKERIQQVLGRTGQDITVRVFGSDLAVMRSKANELRRSIAKIDGVSNTTVQRDAVEPTFEVKVDLAKAQRVGIKPGDVRRAAATLLSGLGVGSLFEEQKVFDVVVWGTPETRASLTDIRNLLIESPTGEHVVLGDVADVRVTSVPQVIRHEDVSRSIDVGADVRGRDVGAVASDIKSTVRAAKFPVEYHAELLGDYASRQAAKTRFIALWVAAAIGILLLLQAALGSWRLASVMFLALPSALVGGLLAALINGGSISLGSLVGFFAVFAIAARSLVLLIEHYQRLEEEGDISRAEVVLRGTQERMVPIFMMAAGGALALLPFIVLGDGPGYELAHPMAVVVIGGLVTSTLLSLFVVPALYLRFAPRIEADQVRHELLDLTAIDGDDGRVHADGKVDVTTTSTTTTSTTTTHS